MVSSDDWQQEAHQVCEGAPGAQSEDALSQRCDGAGDSGDAGGQWGINIHKGWAEVEPDLYEQMKVEIDCLKGMVRSQCAAMELVINRLNDELRYEGSGRLMPDNVIAKDLHMTQLAGCRAVLRQAIDDAGYLPYNYPSDNRWSLAFHDAIARLKEEGE